MNLKKSLLAILLLALIIPVMWSQSNENPGTESATDSAISSAGNEEKSGELWTDEEVQDLVEELGVACQEESGKAADEAVKAAVIPLIAENETLAEDNDLLQKVITGQKYNELRTGIVAGVICFGVGYLVCKIVDFYTVPMVNYQGGL